ncbi:hypothetical protein NLU13_7253 [Sarocladium strictum]|uniref:Uncharacterized protein n=1 Tax=Sarocladium strictum TaxID=5046 RepID=A0AA39GCG1_SARSR|nr:hypothetical protein NLU13_7253 [Sarocladium strictum]
MNSHDTPPDLREIESLILSIYQPNPPEVIARNQAILSQLQSTPTAWSLARNLLNLPDEKVKFFGILTIIVKLNTESAALSQENAEELLAQLLGWYAQSLSAQHTGIVARKISSALSTFFVHFHGLWPHILRHITQSFSKHLLHCQAQHDTHYLTIRAATWVLTSILEDCARKDLNAPNNLSLYQSVLSNTGDAAELLTEGLKGEGVPENILEDSLKCIQAWVSFCIRASVRGGREMEPLRQLMNRVIERLTLESPGEATIELMNEVLNSWPGLLTDGQSERLLALLTGLESQKRFQELLAGGEDFETVSFGNLLLSFAEVNHERLMKKTNSEAQLLISMIRDLLTSKGYPVVEDRLFVPTIEFWSTFAETLADEMVPDEGGSPEPWAQQALGQVIKAVSKAWQKIIYPPHEVVSSWDSNERSGFQEARKDVIDLLQATYALVGPKIVVTFSDLALESIQSQSWFRAEGALFCLGGLSDCARDDIRCDDVLATVFASPLFAILQRDGESIPPRLRQVSVALIEKYTDYFERNSTHLPAALQLLFSVLGEPTISASAARSIQRLCSSCRHHLHSDVEAFLEMYASVVSGRGLDCMVSERIIGAIASVAQAITDDMYKNHVCSRLIDIVEDDVKRARTLASGSNATSLPCAGTPRCFNEAEESPPIHVILRALKSLANIGKGFKALADEPLDLDQIEEPDSSVTSRSRSIQTRIFGLLNEAPEDIGMTAEMTEVTCTVLRSGFAETAPAPFVFAAEDIVDFLTQFGVATPGIGHLVSTGCSFTNSLKKTSILKKQDSLVSLLQWVIGLLHSLEAPENDTELTQNGIDFVGRILYKAPAFMLLLTPPASLEFFFIFTLKVLVGKEPLPKAAAAEFWTSFIGLKSEDQRVQDSVTSIMQMLGPMLCQALAKNIGGYASRSELGKLSEPVKKLVSCYPQSREWLGTAFGTLESDSINTTAEERSLFVKKIISLRGAKTTNQVIREFWLSARGTNFAYAS